MIRKSPKWDVIFYYPQHFNRTNHKTNPFFDPLIKTCELNNLKFLVIEERDKNCNFSRNAKAKKFDAYFFIIQILRKFIPTCFFRKRHHKEVFIGKVFNLLTFSFFTSKNYITISNSLINFWAGVNTTAKVFDLQHGIIYNWHSGYFNSAKILKCNLLQDNIHFFVFGIGFKKIIDDGQPESFQKKLKAHVIGMVNQHILKQRPDFNSQKVVYTLSLTDDFSETELNEMIEDLFNFLKSVESVFTTFNKQLMLRPHPRFTKQLLIENLINKFDFVEEYRDIDKIFCHFSDNSTCIFEFCLQGVPTFIVPNILGHKIFIESFNFVNPSTSVPDYFEKDLQTLEMYKLNSEKSRVWADRFYQEYNSNVFLNNLNLV